MRNRSSGDILVLPEVSIWSGDWQEADQKTLYQGRNGSHSTADWVPWGPSAG